MDVALLYSLLVVFLVVFAGLMSGLTLGLMSQDVMDLKVLERSGSPREQAFAKKILPVVENPHYTLVTLLLCNAFAVEALPLFLDRLVHEITAIVISVTVVLVFGEVVPQALCCRYGLMIGAYSASFVMFLRRITFPISWPISKVLDWAIGSSHTAIFKRPELKALVSLHSGLEGLGGVLTEDEVNVIMGALDMTTKKVENAMTPLPKVFMLSDDEVLDQPTINRIVQTGHSRIPVHSGKDKKQILGLLLVKELVVIDADAKVRVKDLKMRSVPHLPADQPMYDVLNLFKTGRSHMAVLTKGQGALEGLPMDWDAVERASNLEPVGIVTIEDLIEELLQGEIVDETDQFVDNLQTNRVNASIMASRLPPHVKRLLTTFTPSLGNRPSWRHLGRMSSVASHEEQLPSVPLLPKSSPSHDPGGNQG